MNFSSGNAGTFGKLYQTLIFRHIDAFGKDAPGFLPVIPLMGSVSATLDAPKWPKGAFEPSSIHDALDARLGKLADLAAKDLLGSQGWPTSWILNLIVGKLRDGGTDKAIAAITTALQDADLY